MNPLIDIGSAAIASAVSPAILPVWPTARAGSSPESRSVVFRVSRLATEALKKRVERFLTTSPRISGLMDRLKPLSNPQVLHCLSIALLALILKVAFNRFSQFETSFSSPYVIGVVNMTSLFTSLSHAQSVLQTDEFSGEAGHKVYSHETPFGATFECFVPEDETPSEGVGSLMRNLVTGHRSSLDDRALSFSLNIRGKNIPLPTPRALCLFTAHVVALKFTMQAGWSNLVSCYGLAISAIAMRISAVALKRLREDANADVLPSAGSSEPGARLRHLTVDLTQLALAFSTHMGVATAYIYALKKGLIVNYLLGCAALKAVYVSDHLISTIAQQLKWRNRRVGTVLPN